MDEPRLQPGTLVGDRYRVVRTLRAGGMGVVVEAEHVRLGRRVAIKLLHPDVSRRDEVRERFEREGRTTSQLASEHVVEVLDIGEAEGGETYLVMELLMGRDLDQLLGERGQLPPSEAVDYVIQAAEGIAAAHAAGLVHRDIKPANLFLADRKGKSPVIKLLDFGVTKEAISSATLTSAFFGTPQYMSPEQIESPKHVDARTDQYSLAVVLYELISGVPPFDDDSPAEVAAAVLSRPVPPLRGFGLELSPGLGEVILRALAKRPADRFADLAELAHALAPYGPPACQERVETIFALLGRALPDPVLSSNDDSSADAEDEAGVVAKTIALPAVSPGAPKRTSDDDETTAKIDEDQQARARALLEAQRLPSPSSVVPATAGAEAGKLAFGRTDPLTPSDVSRLPSLPSLPRHDLASIAPPSPTSGSRMPLWVYLAVAAAAAAVTAIVVRWS